MYKSIFCNIEALFYFYLFVDPRGNDTEQVNEKQQVQVLFELKQWAQRIFRKMEKNICSTIAENANLESSYMQILDN